MAPTTNAAPIPDLPSQVNGYHCLLTTKIHFCIIAEQGIKETVKPVHDDDNLLLKYNMLVANQGYHGYLHRLKGSRATVPDTSIAPLRLTLTNTHTFDHRAPKQNKIRN